MNLEHYFILAGVGILATAYKVIMNLNELDVKSINLTLWLIGTSTMEFFRF